MSAHHIFNFLNKSRSPKHKLRDAVKSNDIDSLNELLMQGVDPNMKIEKSGGNRPIHIAATFGYYRIIELLINAGATCNLPNGNGVTALYNAVRFGHPRALQTIFRHSPQILGLDQLWFEGGFVHALLRCKCGPIVSTLLIASPNLRMSRSNLWRNMLDVCVNRVPDITSIQLLFLTGYRNSDKEFVSFEIEIMKTLQTLENEFHCWETSERYEDDAVQVLRQAVDFITDFKRNPQFLKHHCRLTIRSSFYNKCNVYYGVEQLPLPKDLKNYLVFHGKL
ncbi:uncharacterized protein LOC132730689 isoform X2 [Ruditapes philippinarum]|uniref:uncharacterized protein LOC132730689 isoform X2 n=1 Tax=Ruditapes philippinarum TaxID=129788 RepID=UPI00295B1228|nr:uncharacterized protein LOC132730689 isoform X2 [Ruditapes philippinarum]XP_060572851.1 uncharacterized protein LOC132730689 isoform X2 [Ruditapes philippinarum]XP_060572932.1 uncharacterized protein LOC132730689 isoform X2 [Ruditapes philippinarum]XP_060573000.1 uncharacterized protein LOC132730689 isoform X2 [Ruditapes philippinarum]